MILALDTTSEYGSIALLNSTGVLEEASMHSTEGFGHVLYGELTRVLSRLAIDLRDIECFAAASGPGSFTGVRIGLAAVKGLAHAAGRRAVGVSNLQALACFGSAELRATLIDAHRGEIYGAVYDRDLKLRSPEVVTKLSDWIPTLPPSGVELISEDGFRIPGIPSVIAPRRLASAVGQIALARFLAGEADDPAELDANYVRRSDAELLWKER